MAYCKEVYTILNSKGVVFSHLRSHEHAIIDFNKAIEIDIYCAIAFVKEVSTFPKSEGVLEKRRCLNWV